MGSMSEANLVCQAIHAISVCADSMSSHVHLGVIQALLTVAMSEFFIVHGEALVQCLKIIFNLAIATDDKMISLTAHNALLQVCPGLDSVVYVPVCAVWHCLQSVCLHDQMMCQFRCEGIWNV